MSSLPTSPDDFTEPDPFLQPLWEETPDEVASPGQGVRPAPSTRSLPGWPPAAELAGLLAPLANAQDALARLDARAETASAPVRTGLIARLAFREAAGWLAATHAWV